MGFSGECGGSDFVYHSLEIVSLVQNQTSFSEHVLIRALSPNTTDPGRWDVYIANRVKEEPKNK